MVFGEGQLALGAGQRGYYSDSDVSFHDEPGRLFRIVFLNSLLTLLTLGLYRFWGKTRLRRHLWNHVHLNDEPFEYTGTGLELFLGFLVVLLILVPMGLFYAFSEPYLLAYGPGAVIMKDVLFLLLFYVLFNVAIYRARRYRLSRTLWRGVRGGQSGSAFRYALQVIAYSFLTLITAGLAYPVLRTQLYRTRMNNTWFGDRGFEFTGRAGPLVGRWLVVWFTVFGGYFAVTAIITAIIVMPMISAGQIDAETAKTIGGPAAGAASLLVIPLFLIGVALYAWYRAAEFRYFASETRYEDLSFGSELRGRSIVLIYVLYFLLFFALLLALGTGFAWISTLSGIGIEADSMAKLQAVPPQVLAMGAGLVVAFIILLGVLQIVFLLRHLLIKICQSLSISGRINVAAIRQSQQAAPGRGEGLADALDVGSF